jgi:hypothetical protein
MTPPTGDLRCLSPTRSIPGWRSPRRRGLPGLGVRTLRPSCAPPPASLHPAAPGVGMRFSGKNSGWECGARGRQTLPARDHQRRPWPDRGAPVRICSAEHLEVRHHDHATRASRAAVAARPRQARSATTTASAYSTGAAVAAVMARRGRGTRRRRCALTRKAPRLQGVSAPRVGLEPTTLRLTAGCSAN